MHRDLKPGNVLVHKGTFILADFGLSTLKPYAQGSESPFTVGEGHYLAPECEDYADGFSKGIMTRSSDVWSLACMLADIATYIALGAKGVKDFKQSRRIKIRNLVTYTYHCGRNQAHPKVKVWLDELRSARIKDVTYRHFISLIEVTLRIRPDQRPRSPDIAIKLHLITAHSYCNTIIAAYNNLLDQSKAVEADMECRRFLAWKSVMFESEDWVHAANVGWLSEIDYPDIVLLLDKVKMELDRLRTHYFQNLTPLFKPLREIQDGLFGNVPADFRQKALLTFELSLNHTEQAHMSEHDLEEPAQVPEQQLYPHAAIIAVIRRLRQEFSQRAQVGNQALHVPEKEITDILPFYDHSLATRDNLDTGISQKILIEWLKYGHHWQGQVNEQMFKRIEAVAQESGLCSRLQGCAFLPCSGYFHSEARLSFRLVWELPTSSNETKVQTLSEIITSTKDFRHRPSLGSRFRLARSLVTSLLSLHTAGWLHKSISPHNVLCLISKDCKSADWLESSFLAGLSRSREDDPSAFTEGPTTSTAKTYRHPEYAMRPHRFRMDYDYFSLGLVLLEIGVWEYLDRSLKRLRIPFPQDLGPVLLEQRVPLLEHSMGSGYRYAVDACLRGLRVGSTAINQETADADDTDTSRDALLLEFQRRVVQPILECSA